MNLLLLPGSCSLPSLAVRTCLVEEMTQQGKASDKTQTGHALQVQTVPASSGASPGRLHLAVLTQFLLAPSHICFQINPVVEMKGWGCCSSSLPRDANSASSLFPQGRGRPAGSKSADWFQNRRTWPCHRWLSPMITYKLVPEMLASSSFPRKCNSLQKNAPVWVWNSSQNAGEVEGIKGFGEKWDIFLLVQLSVVANQGGLEAIWRKSDCRRSALGGITPCSVLWCFS